MWEGVHAHVCVSTYIYIFECLLVHTVCANVNKVVYTAMLRVHSACTYILKLLYNYHKE